MRRWEIAETLQNYKDAQTEIRMEKHYICTIYNSPKTVKDGLKQKRQETKNKYLCITTDSM